MASTDMVNLNQIRQQAKDQWKKKTQADLYVTVGMGTCGLAAGSADTLTAIEKELQKRGLQATISQVGCVGMCSFEPMVEFQSPGRPRLNYGKATADSVPEIIAAYLDGTPLQKGLVLGQVDETVMVGTGNPFTLFLSWMPKAGKRLHFIANSCASSSPTAV